MRNFIDTSHGNKETFEFFEDTSGRRFQINQTFGSMNTSKPLVDVTHRWQVSPKFEEKLGIVKRSDGKISRPANAKTQNEFIEEYNKTVPEEERIPIRIKDDYSKTGWKSEEMVRNWTEGYVPLNQVDNYYHGHDSLFHVPHFLHVPVEVAKRSQNNMKEIIKLMESEPFRNMDSIKAVLFSDLGSSIDINPLIVVIGSTPSGVIERWNKLILNKDKIRELVTSNWSLTNRQRQALEEALSRFLPGFNEQEAAHQLELARRRALID